MGSAVEAGRYAPPAPGDVSVVVCAYTMQRWGDTQKAVLSLLHQLDPVREVILVVDHNDELYYAACAAFADVQVIASTGPKGLSGARDTGVARAAGSIVAFLDDDAAAAPDWSRELVAGYDGADVIGVGGRIDPVWPTSRPSWWPPEFDWVVGCSYTGPRGRHPVRNMIGANMSLRADVCDTGGFDTRIGRVGADVAGCEETELCIRARRLFPDTEILYQPGAVVRHTVPADGQPGATSCAAASARAGPRPGSPRSPAMTRPWPPSASTCCVPCRSACCAGWPAATRAGGSPSRWACSATALGYQRARGTTAAATAGADRVLTG